MIVLDYRDRRPLYEQLIEKLQEMIFRGILEPDSQLPSVRSLATDLSINPNTIQRAYAELERQGFIYSIKGKGSFVAEGGKVRQKKRTELQQEMEELVNTARELGVTLEELIEDVSRFYGEGGTRG